MKKYAILIDGRYVRRYVSVDLIDYTECIKDAQLFNSLTDAMVVSVMLKGSPKIVEINLDIVSTNVL